MDDDVAANAKLQARMFPTLARETPSDRRFCALLDRLVRRADMDNEVPDELYGQYAVEQDDIDVLARMDEHDFESLPMIEL